MRKMSASNAQERMWVLQNLHPNISAYHVTEAMRLKGKVQVNYLKESLKILIARHPALRTTFDYVNEKLMQTVHEAMPISYTQKEIALDEIGSQLRDELHRSYDLKTGPLFRSSVWKIAEEDWIIVLSYHHIIADGRSSHILFKELGEIYQALATNQSYHGPLSFFEYKNYIQHEINFLQSEQAENQLKFWHEKLKNIPEYLDLPTRQMRSSQMQSNVKLYRSPFSDETMYQIEQLCKRFQVSSFMLMAAFYTFLLAKYTQQKDIVIGVPVAGRNLPDADKVVGLFVNTVALRVTVDNHMTFVDFIKHVKHEAILAYANADIPFEKVVNRVSNERKPGYNPIFQTMLVAQPDGIPTMEIPGVLSEWIFVNPIDAKFDITFFIDQLAEQWFCAIEYREDLFEHAWIARLFNHLVNLIKVINEDACQRLNHIDFLTEQEKQRYVNRYPLHNMERLPTIIESFYQQTQKTPHAIAVSDGSSSLTYQQLACKANHIHHHLKQVGIQPNTFIGIYLNRDINLIAVMLGILQTGCAYVPLDPEYPDDRIRFIIQDADCAVIICNKQFQNKLMAMTEVKLITVEQVNPIPQFTIAHPSRGDDAAYIIYTSGSTGRPKGVVIRHHSVSSLIKWAMTEYVRDMFNTTVASTSICFDLSVFEIFVPLCVGGHVHVVNTVLDLTQNALSVRPTLLNTVPSAMIELIRSGKVPTSVRVVNLAGESLSGDLVSKIYALSHIERVYNLYGPSEDTTYSTYKHVDSCLTTEPTIGHAIEGTNAYVLDEVLQPVPIGVIGELYLSGAGLARGYLNRPDLTAERFLPDPLSALSGSRMYRTGDRVSLTEDGELKFWGRIDDQVKLNGFRIELAEIEHVITEVDGIEAAVVVLKKISEQALLIAYFVGQSNEEDVRQYLKKRLPAHMQPAFLRKLKALPRNTNGKIDRANLPDFSFHQAQGTAPQTLSEKIVAKLFCELLNQTNITCETNFFDVGGHSLLAMQLIAAIKNETGIELPLVAVFENATVQMLACLIDNFLSQQKELPALTPAEKQEKYPLSFIQERLWLMEQFNPGSSMLNICVAARLSGELNVEALKSAVSYLTHRHDQLRMRLTRDDLEWKQSICDKVVVPFYQHNSTSKTQSAELLQDAIGKPFDPLSAPLYRAVLIVENIHQYVFAIVIHHLIGDAWSLNIIMSELQTAYHAYLNNTLPYLPALPVNYIDYACWQRLRLANNSSILHQINYWKYALDGIPERLRLPVDYINDQENNPAAARYLMHFPKDLSQAVEDITKAYQVTPFMFFMSVYMLLLSRITDQKDIIIGTPIANRDKIETQQMVGCCLNTLPIRGLIDDNQLFTEFLMQVKNNCVLAFKNQHAPFEQVALSFSAARKPNQSAVFQVMFVFQGLHGIHLKLDKLQTEMLDVPSRDTQFDLTLMMQDSSQGYLMAWDYRTARFNRNTIEHYAQYLLQLVKEIAVCKAIKIGNLSCLTSAMRQTLLNKTIVNTTCQETFQSLFEQQVSKTPNAIALVDSQKRGIKYHELNTMANQVAHLLIANAVKVEDKICVLFERGDLLIACLLGISKAGAAFIVLDPQQPVERNRSILKDVGPKMIITQSGDNELFDTWREHLMFLNVEELKTYSATNPLMRSRPEHLAYLIFTSGTTGKPKGVMIEHRGVSALRNMQTKTFHVGVGRQILQYAPLTFDAFFWEMTLSLLTGSTLHFVDAKKTLPGSPLAATLLERNIQLITLPPSNLANINQVDFPMLDTIIFAGEACNNVIVRKWQEGRSIFNAYGPSEATVCATVYHCEKLTYAMPPIGQPFAGSEVYVLDPNLELTPYGMVGEIYIGGQGIARGYCNMPDITAERFIPHPFTKIPGARLYRTGDLARVLFDGNLEFTGRCDSQIKLNGIRIEPEEIENVIIASHPSITAVKVVLIQEQKNEMLTAFFIANRDLQKHIYLLQGEAKLKLPRYMQPSKYIQLTEFPLTQNGKLNLRKLTQLSLYKQASENEPVFAASELEKTVMGLWKRVLGKDTINLHDVFFEIGGNSLKLLQLFDIINEHFPGCLQLVDLFKFNTVYDIAAAITRHRSMNVSEKRKTVAFKL